jgi:hypothetical protein
MELSLEKEESGVVQIAQHIEPRNKALQMQQTSIDILFPLFLELLRYFNRLNVGLDGLRLVVAHNQLEQRVLLLFLDFRPLQVQDLVDFLDL